jgi:hypothetical protein
MNDQQLQSLPPKMREAATFCSYWNLASGLDEFLEVLGKPVTEENKLWASQEAAKFRHHGVELRKINRADRDVGELDYTVLKARRSRRDRGRLRSRQETGLRHPGGIAEVQR